jgi:hypothetical protein
VPLSPHERTMSWQAALHTNLVPGEEAHVVRSPSTNNPGETSHRLSIPSPSRQGSISYLGSASQTNPQTWDVHVSDPQSVEPPYINRETRPILSRRQSGASQPNNGPNSDSRNMTYDFTQADSRRLSLASNAVSPTSRNRQPSLLLGVVRRESIREETQRRGSNSQTSNNLGRNGSTAVDPEHGLQITPSPASASPSESLKISEQREPSLAEADAPAYQKQRRWFYILLLFTICGFGLLIGLVLYFKLKSKGTIAVATMPTETFLPQPSVLPITDSSIGAAQVVIGTYFSTAASGVLQTKLVYNDGQGRICIRTKSGEDWLNVQCLEGANPRAGTPLTVLDWLGGPSIYFITADNYLSGIDHMPLNGKPSYHVSLLCIGFSEGLCKLPSPQ